MNGNSRSYPLKRKWAERCPSPLSKKKRNYLQVDVVAHLKINICVQEEAYGATPFLSQKSQKSPLVPNVEASKNNFWPTCANVHTEGFGTTRQRERKQQNFTTLIFLLQTGWYRRLNLVPPFALCTGDCFFGDVWATGN